MVQNMQKSEASFAIGGLGSSARSAPCQNLPNVSIVTITQRSRFKNLLVLYELIRAQTFPNIVEWVIVEGSPCEFDAEKNKQNMQYLLNNHELEYDIVYIERSDIDPIRMLSDLRNLGNDSCRGDIIVCMDDDDFYPSERVQHAVESLDASSCVIAGCTETYHYDYGTNKMYKCIG